MSMTYNKKHFILLNYLETKPVWLRNVCTGFIRSENRNKLLESGSESGKAWYIKRHTTITDLLFS